jgi:hypothetical protein
MQEKKKRESSSILRNEGRARQKLKTSEQKATRKVKLQACGIFKNRLG